MFNLWPSEEIGNEWLIFLKKMNIFLLFHCLVCVFTFASLFLPSHTTELNLRKYAFKISILCLIFLTSLIMMNKIFSYCSQM